jgi:hypothetical protein
MFSRTLGDGCKGQQSALIRHENVGMVGVCHVPQVGCLCGGRVDDLHGLRLVQLGSLRGRGAERAEAGGVLGDDGRQSREAQEEGAEDGGCLHFQVYGV